MIRRSQLLLQPVQNLANLQPINPTMTQTVRVVPSMCIDVRSLRRCFESCAISRTWVAPTRL